MPQEKAAQLGKESEAVSHLSSARAVAVLTVATEATALLTETEKAVVALFLTSTHLARLQTLRDPQVLAQSPLNNLSLAAVAAV